MRRITLHAPARARAARGSGRSARAAPRACPGRRRGRSSTTATRSARAIVAGAVRDHERRAPLHHLAERRADLVLLRRVDRRGRVVEDQHLRVGEDRARDRDALALAARERVAALAEHRLVALGQRARRTRRAPASRRRALDRAVVDASGAREARCCRARCRRRGTCPRTRSRRRGAARRARSSRTSTPPIDTRPELRVVEAREQRGGRRLAGAGARRRARATCPAGISSEKPSSTGAAVLVAEADVVEARRRRASGTAAGRWPTRRTTGSARSTSVTRRAAADGPLQRPDALADRAQRVDEEREVEVEGGERAERDRRRRARGGCRTRARRGCRSAAAPRAPAGTPRRRAQRRAHVRTTSSDWRRKRRGERTARAEPLDDADPGDRLLDERRRVAELLLVDLRALRRSAANSARSRC